MDNRHLWIRSKKQHAVLKIRHTVIKAVRDYFDNNGFMLADTPIFTPAACEGTTTLFEVDYFGDEKAYLTQSGQLYNEATAAAFGKSYAFGPTFRAEKSKTRRHLTEFWMVEPEVAYAGYEDMMDLGEGLILAIVERVLNDRQEELEDARTRHYKARSDQSLRSRGCITTMPSKCCRKAMQRVSLRTISNGAAISVRRTRRICRISSASRFSCITSLPRSRDFISRWTRTAPKLLSASICSHPKATARSSAAASVPLRLNISKSS